MRMFVGKHESHQVNNVDHAHLMPGTCFCRSHEAAQVSMVGHISSAGEHHISGPHLHRWLQLHVDAPREQCSRPHPCSTTEAVAAGHNIHVIAAAQAMVKALRRQLNPVDSTPRITSLLRPERCPRTRSPGAESIVVVAPCMTCEQNVENASGRRQGYSRHCSSHLACCVVIESTTCAKAS